MFLKTHFRIPTLSRGVYKHYHKLYLMCYLSDQTTWYVAEFQEPTFWRAAFTCSIW